MAAVIYGITYGIGKINYVVDDQYLRIRIGPMVVRKFAIEDIRDATVGMSHWTESWGNTIHPATISKKAIIIYRRTGYFKKICITPDDPGGFVETIKAHPCFEPDK